MLTSSLLVCIRSLKVVVGSWSSLAMFGILKETETSVPNHVLSNNGVK